MLHLPLRRFSCQKAASARHVPAGHRKARAAAFPWYYVVIRAGVDCWTEPACSLLPPHTIKWPHPAACGLQAAQPGQDLPGTQQGKPPRRFWVFFFSTCNTNLQKKSFIFHPSSPPAGQRQCAQSPWKWLLRRGPPAFTSPVLAALPFRGLEMQNTSVRGDLSEENRTIHSQGEAQGRSCNWFLT